MPKAPSFTGFAREAPAFWPELAAEMNREWFAANKARYEATWVAPMLALLEAVRGKLAPAFTRRGIQLAEPKVLRIHRDVRFSKDPSPYKTHIGATLMVAGTKLTDSGIAALYIHLGLEEELVGVGSYVFDAPRLARWRKQVAGPAGAALDKLRTRLVAAGYAVESPDQLVRVPKPYDPSHPRAHLLRMKGLTAMFPAIPRGLIHQAAFVDWLVEHGRATAPLVAWLHDHVG